MNNDKPKVITITKVGLLAQWTDSGRRFSQLTGYSQSGAVDWFSFQLGNALCGNSLDSPSIEVMGGMMSFQISDDCVISITGAKADILVNNYQMQMNRLLRLKSGDEVSIGQVEAGLFTYISFAASFTLPLFKESVCAVRREKAGGTHGNGLGLKVNERFEFHQVNEFSRSAASNLFKKSYLQIALPPLFHSLESQQFSNHKQLPMMFSYQHASFTNIDKHRLMGHNYTVSSKFDKMGIRLHGARIYSQSSVLTSQAMANGAIQVPGDGQPIIMRNDRQTIGGYPVIGVISSVGLAVLSQVTAHEVLSFIPTNIETSIISRRFINIQLNRVLNEVRTLVTNAQ